MTAVSPDLVPGSSSRASRRFVELNRFARKRKAGIEISASLVNCFIVRIVKGVACRALGNGCFLPGGGAGVKFRFRESPTASISNNSQLLLPSYNSPSL